MPLSPAHANAIVSSPYTHLPPEQVVVLRRRGGVSDVHVDTVSIGSSYAAVTQLEEPLESAGGVLRAKPIIAMR